MNTPYKEQVVGFFVFIFDEKFLILIWILVYVVIYVLNDITSYVYQVLSFLLHNQMKTKHFFMKFL